MNVTRGGTLGIPFGAALGNEFTRFGADPPRGSGEGGLDNEVGEVGAIFRSN